MGRGLASLPSRVSRKRLLLSPPASRLEHEAGLAQGLFSPQLFASHGSWTRLRRHELKSQAKSQQQVPVAAGWSVVPEYDGSRTVQDSYVIAKSFVRRSYITRSNHYSVLDTDATM